MNLIHRLAFRYKDNILAKVLVRPIYRMLIERKLSRKKKVFRQNAKLLLEKIESMDLLSMIVIWILVYSSRIQQSFIML